MRVEAKRVQANDDDFMYATLGHETRVEELIGIQENDIVVVRGEEYVAYKKHYIKLREEVKELRNVNNELKDKNVALERESRVKSRIIEKMEGERKTLKSLVNSMEDEIEFLKAQLEEQQEVSA